MIFLPSIKILFGYDFLGEIFPFLGTTPLWSNRPHGSRIWAVVLIFFCVYFCFVLFVVGFFFY